MKKLMILTVIGLCAGLPLFAQASARAGNAALVSWTVGGVEKEDMKAQVTNVAIQPSGNNLMQYSLQLREGAPIRFIYDRVNKTLRCQQGNEVILNTGKVSLRESGSAAILTFTDKDDAENVLNFQRK
jgi:hypothetical protein